MCSTSRILLSVVLSTVFQLFFSRVFVFVSVSYSIFLPGFLLIIKICLFIIWLCLQEGLYPVRYHLLLPAKPKGV